MNNRRGYDNGIGVNGRRIDDAYRGEGSMWVATLAALLMVFAAGVFVGWAV